MKTNNNMVYPEIKGYYAKMNIDVIFPDRISFLYGDSGTGKSFLVEALNKQGLAIEVFDHRDLHEEKINNIKRFIKNTKDFLIIIDNADIILDDELRELIYEDINNQYLIVGRDPHNLFLSKHNFVDINVKGNDISFVSKF